MTYAWAAAPHFQAADQPMITRAGFVFANSMCRFGVFTWLGVYIEQRYPLCPTGILRRTRRPSRELNLGDLKKLFDHELDDARPAICAGAG